MAVALILWDKENHKSSLEKDMNSQKPQSTKMKQGIFSVITIEDIQFYK